MTLQVLCNQKITPLHFIELRCGWTGADFIYGTAHAASAVFGRATLLPFRLYTIGG